MSENYTPVNLPKVIFGTSGLGNLYVAMDIAAKCEIVREIFNHSPKPVVFDSAGKYGAGLALEALGECLHRLGVKQDEVMISNKLGWLRTELKTPEPTFEPGVWRDLKFDALQKISYNGILECYEQGNQLLKGYRAELVSVHDPDEYLAAASDEADEIKRYQDILDAYRALFELKEQGKVKAVGLGSKDWHIIQKITEDVNLDWVMIANSMTVHSHPKDLIAFMEELDRKGIAIINSAVFNAGFLIGSDYYNYHLMDRTDNAELFEWRDNFFELCDKHGVKPAEAAVAFGLHGPGVKSIALNTTNAARIQGNVEMANVVIPADFWADMKEQGLIDNDYAYL